MKLDVAPVVLALYTVDGTANINGAALHPRLLAKLGAPAVPIGEARRIRSATKVFLRIFVYSLTFAFERCTNCSTNSIGVA